MKRNKEDNSLRIHIGKLWNSGEGTVEKFSLDVPVVFEDPELKAKSNFSADLMLIKLKEEISVVVSDGRITLDSVCEKCLGRFDNLIEIREAEREFMGNRKAAKPVPGESFFIDFTDMSIDLKEMIRQEIFLHFPLISVCSKSCKGICPVCGQNRNKKKCDCRVEEAQINKPFKDLKKLMSK